MTCLQETVFHTWMSHSVNGHGFGVLPQILEQLSGEVSLTEAEDRSLTMLTVVISDLGMMTT